MMLHSVRCLWQDLRRVHHILVRWRRSWKKRGSLPAKAGLTTAMAVCWQAALAAEELHAC
jgi:hypothetical protein